MPTTGSEDFEERFQRIEDFILSSFEEDLMVMHVETRDTVVLNATGMAIWEALKWPQSINTLTEILMEAFPKQQQDALGSQVAEVLRTLRSRGLVACLKDS